MGGCMTWGKVTTVYGLSMSAKTSALLALVIYIFL